MPEAKWHPYCDDAPDESDPRADKLGIISLIIETLLEAAKEVRPEKLVWPVWKLCFAERRCFEDAESALRIGHPHAISVGVQICAACNRTRLYRNHGEFFGQFDCG